MSKKIICLFDVDGTLTVPLRVSWLIFSNTYRFSVLNTCSNLIFYLQEIDTELDKFLQTTVKKQFDVAVVGGSDLKKIKHQLGEENIFKKYNYVFAENGLIAYKDGKKLPGEVSITSSLVYIVTLTVNNKVDLLSGKILEFFKIIYEKSFLYEK